jgi:hypothetical protein
MKYNMVSGEGVLFVWPCSLLGGVHAIVDVVVESVLDVALESSVSGVLFDLELGVLMHSCLLSIFRTLSRHIFSVRPWASLCNHLPGPRAFLGW